MTDYPLQIVAEREFLEDMDVRHNPQHQLFLQITNPGESTIWLPEEGYQFTITDGRFQAVLESTKLTSRGRFFPVDLRPGETLELEFIYPGYWGIPDGGQFKIASAVGERYDFWHGEIDIAEVVRGERT